MSQKFWLVTAAVCTALSQSPWSKAQGTQPPAPEPAATNSSDDQSGGALAEVTVTAEKRVEVAQKTAVAVAVTNTDELTRAGAQQLQDIQKVVPDIKLDKQGQGMTVSIRGVYSTDNSPTAEAANAIHINGAYLAKNTALGGLLYDLERVEVAKGPQGTLYGRNANGGAINIITHKPVIGDDDGFGELEVGNYELRRFTGAANVSASDTLAFRIAGQSYDRNGYYVSGLGDAGEKSGRVSALWKPTDVDSLYVVADFEQIGSKGDGSNVVAAQPGAPHAYPIASNPWDDTYYVTDIPGTKAQISHSISKIAVSRRSTTAIYPLPPGRRKHRGGNSTARALRPAASGRPTPAIPLRRNTCGP